MENFVSSPFIVPVAGCAVGAVAIVSGIWFEAQQRRNKAEQRTLEVFLSPRSRGCWGPAMMRNASGIPCAVSAMLGVPGLCWSRLGLG
jgi:hypothetical protein